MSIARQQKEINAQTLRDELSGVPHAIVVDFKRLNVEGATNLRRTLRDSDAHFKVVKNTTMLRAIDGLPMSALNDVFVGQSAIAYTDGDVVKLAKVLCDFAKELETPTFKAGMVDGAPISAEQFDELSKLPPREQLIAKALYLMNYPITGFVTALSAILQSFVVVLDQIREQKEAAGDSEPVAVEEAPAEDVAAEAAPAEEAPAEDVAAEAAPAEEAPAEEVAAEAAPVEEAPVEEAAADDAPAEPAEAASGEEEAK